MKTSETLYAAADHIREHGWTQGTSQDALGRVCMLGAVCLVITGDAFEWLDGDQSPLCALRAVTGGSTIASFNDDHCETADDAIAALEIAADIAFEEGR